VQSLVAPAIEAAADCVSAEGAEGAWPRSGESVLLQHVGLILSIENLIGLVSAFTGVGSLALQAVEAWAKKSDDREVEGPTESGEVSSEDSSGQHEADE
jgi:hypothetical protein